MSFTVFRKYEKPLLIAACVFTVVVFAFFPSMGGISDVMGAEEGDLESTYGTFTVETTGETRRVTLGEFVAARNKLNRLFRNANSEFDDSAVWAHIIETADAFGAGVHVSDQELLDQLKLMTGDMIQSQADYQYVVRSLIGFPSLDTFEDFMREVVAKERWREVKLKAATVVPAADVYQRWRVDNERFDYEALVFADLEPEAIEDPGDDVLREHYDGLPEWQRNSAFVDPARHDVAYGWLPFDALSEVPADIVDTLETPTDAEVDLRFQTVKAQRFPDLDELDADTREALRDELRVIALVRRAHEELAALAATDEPADDHDHDGDGVPDHPVEDETAHADDEAADDAPALDTATFLATLSAQGLRTADPEGLLDPDALAELEGIGSQRLAGYLRLSKGGDLHYAEPFYGDSETHIVFVQSQVDQRTLDFDEGREQVLEHWRAAQVSQPARDARDALRERARELESVATVIGPIEEQAQQAADDRIAAEEGDDPILAGLDDEEQQTIRDEELAAVQPAIDAAVAEAEHEVWDALAAEYEAAGSAERRTLSDIAKSYRSNPDPDEDAASLERFLKINTAIFQQAVDGVTNVLRHPGSSTSVIVRVTARRFPEMGEMLADAEGLQTARKAQSNTARFSFFSEYSPDAIMASHELAVVERPDPEAEGEQDGEPQGS